MLLFLFFLWVVFNGGPTVEIIIFGIILCAALYLFMAKAFSYTLKKELKLYIIAPMLIWYAITFIFEVIKANLQTAGTIISRKYSETEPLIVHFKTSLKSDFFRVLLANSITMTPGTITVSLKDDEYVIHCLDRSFGDGLDATAFEKRLAVMEKRWLA